jgi:hypothetical protein
VDAGNRCSMGRQELSILQGCDHITVLPASRYVNLDDWLRQASRSVWVGSNARTHRLHNYAELIITGPGEHCSSYFNALHQDESANQNYTRSKYHNFLQKSKFNVSLRCALMIRTSENDLLKV